MMRQRIPRWPRLQPKQMEIENLQEEEFQSRFIVTVVQKTEEEQPQADNRTELNDVGLLYRMKTPILDFASTSCHQEPSLGNLPTPSSVQARTILPKTQPVMKQKDWTTPTLAQLSETEDSLWMDVDDDEHDNCTIGEDSTLSTLVTLSSFDAMPNLKVDFQGINIEDRFHTVKPAPLSGFQRLIRASMCANIGKEIQGTFSDARDAFHQVFHAFTLGDGDIHCVCGHLNFAKTEYTECRGTIPWS